MSLNMLKHVLVVGQDWGELTKIGFGGLLALNEPVPQTVKFALSYGQRHALTLSQSGQTPFTVTIGRIGNRAGEAGASGPAQFMIVEHGRSRGGVLPRRGWLSVR